MISTAAGEDRYGSLTTAIARLRQLVQQDVRSQWYSITTDLPIHEIHPAAGTLANLDEKGYLSWAAGKRVQWFVQDITIPFALQGYELTGFSLRLVLAWWAESAQIFVRGKLLQSGDLFDSSGRFLLSLAVSPGETLSVALRLVSPGHDIGALMKSHLIFEREPIDPGFVADELTVLYRYLEWANPEALEELDQAIAALDWTQVDNREAFDRQLLNLRQVLQPLAQFIKERQFHLLGHAHLDMAWLWTTAETWEVGERTFRSVLNLQQAFPDLTFGHTSPALYDWIAQHRPELLQAIQGAIGAGQWELLGGMWIEPEMNLIAGESIVRQLLYGQQYYQRQFGQQTRVAWLIDSFGFCWQMPQLLKQSGIDYFVTGKLHWNDSTTFPYGAFHWRSPDGSQVLTLMSPPNVEGIMDTHPLTMVNYALQWEEQTSFKDIFWIPGVGDHGGGPTRDMLTVAQRWQTSPFFPQIAFDTSLSYLQKLETASLSNQQAFPVWEDELYLEFHRGCYTTHADQKAYNRRCETLLFQAELWAAIACWLYGAEQFPYPQAPLTQAWKKVLFNQFHDILPGTSIPEVFTEANQDWQWAQTTAQEIRDRHLQAIAQAIALPPPPTADARPVVIFNDLTWTRSQVITLAPPDPSVLAWTIYDERGQRVPSQGDREGNCLFLAKDIPGVGYRLYWLCPESQEKSSAIHANLEGFILENDDLRVEINPHTGDIDRCYHKPTQREILQGAGNQLQAFRDWGQYWDAWNIDPNYAQHPLAPSRLLSIAWLEKGLIQSRIRVVRQLEQSIFTQDYVLDSHGGLLKIETQVDWQETQVLVKAAFPVTPDHDLVTYEIPYGAIARPSNPQTPADQAKWEVPALRWADLSDRKADYGVSLLNDCKYGYDAQPHCLRLTLLRSPQWPHPDCDRHVHRFTYALYPHGGNWQTAKTVHQGYELNQPLIAIIPATTSAKADLPPKAQLLGLPAKHLILSACKRHESDPHRWLLRLYDAYGVPSNLSLNSPLGLTLGTRLNLLEDAIAEDRPVDTSIQPWQVATFEILVPKSSQEDDSC